MTHYPRQKVYLIVKHLSVAQKRKIRRNAYTRPCQENDSAKSKALQENMQRLWSHKRFNGHQMPQVPRKEPALEETRNREVNHIFTL